MPRAQEGDFSPADPGAYESANFTFDFTSGLDAGAGETVASSSWQVALVDGVDADPSSRMLGPSYIQSDGARVTMLLGTFQAGAVYRVACTAVTTAGQRLTCWAHVPCFALA